VRQRKMTKIKTQVSKFSSFINAISCEGADETGKTDRVIKEFVIKAIDGKIETYAADKVGKLFSHIRQNMEVLEPGEIIIGDVGTMMKVLSAFEPGDNIVITQDSGFIVFLRETPKLRLRVATISKENMGSFQAAEMINSKWKFNEDKTVLGTDKTKLDCVFKVKVDDFKKIVKYSNIVGEQHYPFIVEKDETTGEMKLIVKVGSLETSMVDIESSIPAEMKSVELSNKYAYGFDNVFSSLSGNVTIFTAPNMPLWIFKEEPDRELRYMILPIVD